VSSVKKKQIFFHKKLVQPGHPLGNPLISQPRHMYICTYIRYTLYYVEHYFFTVSAREFLQAALKFLVMIESIEI
jgi:hypothetical protein